MNTTSFNISTCTIFFCILHNYNEWYTWSIRRHKFLCGYGLVTNPVICTILQQNAVWYKYFKIVYLLYNSQFYPIKWFHYLALSLEAPFASFTGLIGIDSFTGYSLKLNKCQIIVSATTLLNAERGRFKTIWKLPYVTYSSGIFLKEFWGAA